MAFLTTVIDGARQTSDATLQDGKFVVITIPLCIFENAGKGAAANPHPFKH